ncbi:hypothetical protein Droror1_Dr00010267 [Drosera rotundifolia]
MGSVGRRAEIDTRPPFRSVKEAVSLFGERVLAGELYSPAKLKSIQQGETNIGHVKSSNSKIGSVTTELEQTKQSLQKAKEEAATMASSISYLREELERTKGELEELKQRESENKRMFEVEDLKYVEESLKHQATKAWSSTEEEGYDYQKKKYVSFANPPIAQFIAPASGCGGDQMLERHPSRSMKNKKKKNAANFAPFLGGLFSKKNKNNQSQFGRSP